MTVYQYRCDHPNPEHAHIITNPTPLDRCKGYLKGRPCPHPLVRIGAGSRAKAEAK